MKTLPVVEEVQNETLIVKNAVERAPKGSEQAPKAQFYLHFDPRQLRGLTDAQLSLFAWEAAVNFGCRTGKGAEKLEGRTLDLGAIIKHLEESGGRSGGGPTKGDVALAEQRLVVVKATAHKAAHDVDEDSANYGNVDAFIILEIGEIAERNIAAKPGLTFDYNTEQTPLVNLSRLYRDCRLYMAREAARKQAVI